MRVAVFDLDGTLADTSADLIAAANAALAEAGVAPALGPGDRAIAFAGGRAMLRAGFARAMSQAGSAQSMAQAGSAQSMAQAGPAKAARAVDAAAIEAAYPRLLAHYEANIDRHTRTYEGAEAALDALAAAGWGLAVCTNKPFGLAETLLDRLGLRRRFAVVLGADSLPVRKPDPRHVWETIDRAGGTRERAVLVGDTVTDREAARAAGVPCVLVGFGPEGAGVAALEPEAVLDRYADLPALLDRLSPARETGPAQVKAAQVGGAQVKAAQAGPAQAKAALAGGQQAEEARVGGQQAGEAGAGEEQVGPAQVREAGVGEAGVGEARVGEARVGEARGR